MTIIPIEQRNIFFPFHSTSFETFLTQNQIIKKKKKKKKKLKWSNKKKSRNNKHMRTTHADNKP